MGGLVEEGKFGNSGAPYGRIWDEGPSPIMVNNFYRDIQFMMVPENILITKRDEMVTMLFSCLSNGSCPSGDMYLMGGKIPSADDGMNSFPPHRRHGAFLMIVSDRHVRTKFYRLFNDIGEGEVW